MRFDRSFGTHGKEVWQEELLQYAGKNSFCTLITCDTRGLFLSHINLIQNKGVFFGHLSAANPQAKQIKNSSAVAAIFKDINQRDPNIAAVHMQGSIRTIHDEEELISNMSNLISKYENGRVTPWLIDWTDPKFKSQLKGVVGFYIAPDKIEEVKSQSSISCEPALSSISSNPIYTPKYFDEKRSEVLEEFINRQKICTLVVHKNNGSLQVYHTKLDLTSTSPGKMQLTGDLGELNKNSHIEPGDTLNAVAIFNGPHTYISPTWYKTPHSVPTWNYITAHVHGTINIVKKDKNENGCVLGVELEVSRIDGKYKLNQNRTLEDKEGVVSGLTNSTSEDDQQVGKLMQRFSLGK